MVSKKWPKNEEVTRRRTAIYNMIASNPCIRAEEMAERLGVKREIINDDTSYLGFKRRSPKYIGKPYYNNEKGLKEYAVYNPEYDVWEPGYISKEDAIKEAQSFDEDSKIGEVVRYRPQVDAIPVLEAVEDDAYWFTEYSEGWLQDGFETETLEELELRLQEAFIDWLIESHMYPGFFIVRNEIDVRKAE